MQDRTTAGWDGGGDLSRCRPVGLAEAPRVGSFADGAAPRAEPAIRWSDGIVDVGNAFVFVVDVEWFSEQEVPHAGIELSGLNEHVDVVLHFQSADEVLGAASATGPEFCHLRLDIASGA